MRGFDTKALIGWDADKVRNKMNEEKHLYFFLRWKPTIAGATCTRIRLNVQ